jgi:hypothetical protein
MDVERSNSYYEYYELEQWTILPWVGVLKTKNLRWASGWQCWLNTNILWHPVWGSSQGLYCQPTNQQQTYQILRYFNQVHAESACPIYDWKVKNESKVTHRCFLTSFGSFGQAVSEEKIKKNQPIRNKNRLWQPCLLTDQDKMSILYRGPYNNACSFRPDPLTNMATTGNSCFWLADF